MFENFKNLLVSKLNVEKFYSLLADIYIRVLIDGRWWFFYTFSLSYKK